MYNDRQSLYSELESIRESKLLVYVTGDRQGMETQMHPEVIDRFVDHLDSFENTQRITLLLHSRGGDTSAGWSVANLIRSFCSDFEVIVPARAHSAATLLCLGADRIFMTKQATLGPIDPNVNTPLNPQVPGGGPNARVGVSVESIKGYVDLAREEFGIEDSKDMTAILESLANQVHPLVLGNVFRARHHIRLLARTLLEKQLDPDIEKEKIDKIVNFLCSDSGSHDYTINRTEAREKLGLTIEKPDDQLYNIIKGIYDDIAEELQLRKPFIPVVLASASPGQEFCCRRALIESLHAPTEVFISKGVIDLRPHQTPQGMVTQIQDHRSFEGWQRETHERNSN